MKKVLLILATSLCLCACTSNNNNNGGGNGNPPADFVPNVYGAFLGRDENNITGFENYKYVSIDVEGYSKTTIDNLKKNKNQTQVLGYLNVGSVETYRDYYSRFESITFADYENWPDERWIDVTNTEWQNYVIETLAPAIKAKGAYGVYMDNVDVYSVCKEMSRPTAGVITALKNIINGVNNKGLKVMVNGGAEFFDDLFDSSEGMTLPIWAYHQEEVFSLIEDYDNDEFGTQEKEDREYYQSIAKKMKKQGSEVFFLEYTTDSKLIEKIHKYCYDNNYFYYASSTVDLK